MASSLPTEQPAAERLHEEETEFSDRAQVAEDYSQVGEEGGPATASEMPVAASVPPAEEASGKPAGGSEDTSSVVQKKSKRRRKRRRKPSTEAASQETDTEDRSDAVSFEEDMTETGAEKEASGDEGAGKNRAKRRRRRSAKKKKGAEEVEGAAEPDREPVLETAGVPETEDAWEHGEADTAGEAGHARRKHRDIPTWEETVGMLLATNRQNRAKRPSRGRGAGKGRSEGRN